MDFFHSGSYWIVSTFPTVLVQESSQAFDFFAPFATQYSTLILLLGSLMTFALVSISIGIKFNRWRKFNLFLEAMRAIDLDSTSQMIFAWMVKRNRLKEPSGVLRSRRIFDEMASGEIFRVLCSAGTLEAKEGFIDTVYNIRNKTFHPDRMERDETIC